MERTTGRGKRVARAAPKLRKSCDWCAKLKRRCDGLGHQVCHHCRQMGRHCTYSHRKTNATSIEKPRSNAPSPRAAVEPPQPAPTLTRETSRSRAAAQKQEPTLREVKPAAISPSLGIGLVGLVENSLLNTFFREFANYLPVVTENPMKEVLRSVMAGNESGGARRPQVEATLLSSFWATVALGAYLQGMGDIQVSKYLSLSDASWNPSSSVADVSKAEIPKIVQNLLLRACTSAFQGDESRCSALVSKADSLWATLGDSSGSKLTSLNPGSSAEILRLETVMKFMKRFTSFSPNNPMEWSLSMVEETSNWTQPTALVVKLKASLKQSNIKLFLSDLEGAFIVSSCGRLLQSMNDPPLKEEFQDNMNDIINLIEKAARASAAAGVAQKSTTVYWLATLKHIAGDLVGAAESYRLLINLFENVSGLLKFPPFGHRCENAAAAVHHMGMTAEYERLRTLFNQYVTVRRPLPPATDFAPQRHCCQHFMCRDMLRRLRMLTLDDCLECLSTMMPVKEEPEASDSGKPPMVREVSRGSSMNTMTDMGGSSSPSSSSQGRQHQQKHHHRQVSAEVAASAPAVVPHLSPVMTYSQPPPQPSVVTLHGRPVAVSRQPSRPGLTIQTSMDASMDDYSHTSSSHMQHQHEPAKMAPHEGSSAYQHQHQHHQHNHDSHGMASQCEGHAGRMMQTPRSFYAEDSEQQSGRDPLHIPMMDSLDVLDRLFDPVNEYPSFMNTNMYPLVWTPTNFFVNGNENPWKK